MSLYLREWLSILSFAKMLAGQDSRVGGGALAYCRMVVA